MVDFPAKVNTETSSHHYQNTHQGGLRGLTANISNTMDMSFIRSIPAILMMVEMFTGLLHWALISSTIYVELPVYGWVMFVAVTTWIITTILFLMMLLSVHQRLSFVPWPMTVMVYHGVATVLYITAFVANAANVYSFNSQYHLAAAAFFGAVTTLAYAASAMLSYLDWRGDGGNAAGSTVPT